VGGGVGVEKVALGLGRGEEGRRGEGEKNHGDG
jgi:hypothetical protein